MEKPFKILLLEDEVDINNLWTKSLTKDGYNVNGFTDGQKLIDSLSINNNYHLAVLDWMVPGASGIKVAKYLNEKYPNIYIIILTSKTDIEDINNGFKAGANEYLKKPCSIAELRIRIQQIINKKLAVEKLKLNHYKCEVNDLECSIKIKNRTYFLSTTGYKIVSLLLKNKSSAMTKKEIINSIWGLNVSADSKILEVNIYNIRKRTYKNIIKSNNKGYYIDEELV